MIDITILSLVVPTYNMEKYLSRCLSSVCIDKSYGLVEVIVVNDGSKDSSLSIAYSFKKKYPHIIRVIDKPNGNYGSCINAALKVAKGKYIKILDADDMFDTESFVEFISYLEEIDTDLFLSDFAKVDESSKIIKEYTYNFTKGNCYKLHDLLDIDEIWMHAVTYRTDILREINYKQTEGISYTDQEWIFLPMSTVHQFYYFPQTVYLYSCGRDGQTVAPEIFAKKFNEEIQGFEVMLDEYLNVEVNDDARKYLTKRLLTRASTIYSFGLIYGLGKVGINQIVDFDLYIAKKSPELYSLTEIIDAPVKKTRIKFVKSWRKNNYRISPVLILLHHYKSIRKKITSR